MSKPIEFNEFYKLLTAVKDGDTNKKEKLDWILAEYEHAEDSKSIFDELGQIFCHIGVMELFKYTGSDDIKFISSLHIYVCDYLEVRLTQSLQEYLVGKMICHSKDHNLVIKLSEKWSVEAKEIESNVQDLAKYVAEGIIDVVK